MSDLPGPRAVLIGSMGAGKSTVARVLATRWNVGVRDTDADVEVASGKSIPAIFADDGEAAFRALEHDAVTRALREHHGVLSLGGGAILDERTRQALEGHRVVFLKVGLADALVRVGGGNGRPLLAGDVRARVETLIAERTPIYESVATLVVDTDGRSPDQVADQIMKELA